MSDWQATTFSGLLNILDNPRTTVAKACQAVEDCLASNG